MSKSPSTNYIVMGEDGKDYGPVTAAEIREWVADGRLEKKSPVKSGGGKDWLFLGDLPEFANLFAVKSPRLPGRRPRKALVKAFVIVAVLTAIYFLVEYLRNH
jgi:hypothetical protein